MRIDSARRQMLDLVLGRFLELDPFAAGVFRPTSNWDSAGLLLDDPRVLILDPSFVFDSDTGIWNVSVAGAQAGQAERGELLATLCACVARSLNLALEPE